MKNNSGVKPAGQCGTWVKEPEGGLFTSPNFPNKYPPDTECVYILEGKHSLQAWRGGGCGGEKKGEQIRQIYSLELDQSWGYPGEGVGRADEMYWRVRDSERLLQAAVYQIES